MILSSNLFCLSAEEKKCCYFPPPSNQPCKHPPDLGIKPRLCFGFGLDIAFNTVGNTGAAGQIRSIGTPVPSYFYYALGNTSANTQTLVVLPCREGIIGRLWVCVNIVGDFM